MLEALKGREEDAQARTISREQTVASQPVEAIHDGRDVRTLAGEVIRNSHLRVAFMHQNHLTKLEAHLDSTSSQYLAERLGCTDLHARHLLGAVGLRGNHVAHRAVRELSGGERTRLVFASEVLLIQPHLLLLDEPTNHLDLEAVEGLIIALDNFDGAVVCVSHSRHFIASFAREVWHVRRPERATPIACVDVRHAEDPHAVEDILDSLWSVPSTTTGRASRPTPPTQSQPPLPQSQPRPLVSQQLLQLKEHPDGAAPPPASLPAPPPVSSSVQPNPLPPPSASVGDSSASASGSSAPAGGNRASASGIVAANFEESCKAAEELKLKTQAAAEKAERKAAKAGKKARRAILNGDADADELQVEAARLSKTARQAAKAAAEVAAVATESAAVAAAAEERMALMRQLGISQWEAIELEKRKREGMGNEAARKVWIRSPVLVDESGFQTVKGTGGPQQGRNTEGGVGARNKATSVEVTQLMEAMSISEEEAICMLRAAEGDVNRAIDVRLHELA